jgi:2-oxoglutarate ferredoxin oxidoreductase subunit delta
MKGSIKIKKELCKGCMFCMTFCPKHCIALSEKLNKKGYLVAEFDEHSGCTGCATCGLMCPEIAIEVYRG